ncbi:glycoside hydrolase family 3 N-terminal domain-containing protein [Bifidobacterium bifidum]|uniref:beta-N-acetylhexosaminidase n=1 Tax=Bifidobacterium bifidum (strain PRL2010) TaxID=702459 RepID=A0A0H3EC33_BIFBP|nr:glycoside hydrolase family 3 N-terminal domain-containing protein [Bifidobacterium bifidum]ADP35785.1 Glycoside hydrolase, family 3 domain protein [Bifidobacterium bifidum PRL2010]KLN80968.1 glycoside hydrolase, family 3 [Bifidobacterium bifidum]MCZ4480745.1 glycoside hydrolase family 3 protein [Bifidobacterium bifidum]MCZ4484444.1 glycoside hydrolase family 3 protein [Bifidobacterium bifidum]MDB1307020.1 glycoside hydrolase family 3 N-terminal domain-containing protein [Bifidobacterium bif
MQQIKHGGRRPRPSSAPTIIAAMLCVVALVTAGTAWWMLRPQQKDTLEHLAQPQSSSSTLNRDKAPTPKPQKSQEHQKAADDSPAAKASRAIATMSLDERAGQLIMAPMFAGGNPADLSALISTRHVGSVVLIGNWNNGTAAAKTAADALQSYAPSGNQLIVSTDQEGGQVQHLKGSGFDTMPSAVAQGQMSADTLRSSAKTWGGQLKQAGINIDLAPVLGTVQVKRSSNAPIGALNRDFGLDSNGNAQHGIAFVEGMRDAGVGATVKHYPGLGAVTGNTDFTTEGILDTTTTLDDEEIGAFNTTIKQAKPAMVMMSLATYQRIDSSAPAAFSSKIIDGTLRGSVGYDGVVISDSLSAAAVSGIATKDLGVRLVDAGGDLACIGDTSYVTPILDGIIARAQSDPAFAKKVTASATRVMTLKYQMGLAK